MDLVECSEIESCSDSGKSGEPGGSDIVNERGINEGGINEEGLMTEDEGENDGAYNVAYNA